MFSDIVFPKDNEKKLINIAIRLGYSRLYLIYDHEDEKKIKNDNIEIKTGVKADLKNINKFRKADFVLMESSEKLRHMIEKNKPDIIYNIELVGKKDFMHHRNSGLNQVLCRLANKNKVKFGINFNNLIKNTKLSKEKIIGRLKQNIKLCRKFKVKLIIGSFATTPYEMRNPRDLLSLGITLGMHPKEAKDSLNY